MSMAYTPINQAVDKYTYIILYKSVIIDNQEVLIPILPPDSKADEDGFIKISGTFVDSSEYSRYVSEYLTVPSIISSAKKSEETEEEYQYRVMIAERTAQFFQFNKDQENTAQLIKSTDIGHSLFVCCARGVKRIEVYTGENGEQELAFIVDFTSTNEVSLPKVVTISKLENEADIPVHLHKCRVNAHGEDFCGVKGTLHDNSILTKQIVNGASRNNILDRQGVFAIANDQQIYFLGTPCLYPIDNNSNRRGQFPYSGSSIVGDSNIVVGEDSNG